MNPFFVPAIAGILATCFQTKKMEGNKVTRTLRAVRHLGTLLTVGHYDFILPILFILKL